MQGGSAPKLPARRIEQSVREPSAGASRRGIAGARTDGSSTEVRPAHGCAAFGLANLACVPANLRWNERLETPCPCVS